MRDQKLSINNSGRLGSYEKVPQDTTEKKSRFGWFKKCIDFILYNFKGYLMAVLAAANFCIGNIIMKKANNYVNLSGFDHLVIFFMMTLLTLPGITKL